MTQIIYLSKKPLGHTAKFFTSQLIGSVKISNIFILIVANKQLLLKQNECTFMSFEIVSFIHNVEISAGYTKLIWSPFFAIVMLLRLIQ